MASTQAVAQFIESRPLNKFHLRTFLIGGSGYFFDALDVASLSFIIPVLVHAWHLTLTQTGEVGSSTFIGYFFGALLAGFLGDKIGRKPVMLLGLVIYCVASIACALSPGIQSFMLLRGISGFGVGIESVIIAPYLTEFVPTCWRGRFAGGMASFMSFGFLAAALLGYAFIPQGPNGWRIFTALCGAPLLLAPIWMKFLRESPFWLASQGRLPEASTILQDIYGETLSAKFSDPAQKVTPSSSFRELISKETLYKFVSINCVWFFFMFSYYAFFTWIPQLLVLNGTSLSNSIYYSIATFSAQIPGYFTASLLNDRLGTHRVLMLYISGAVLTCLGIALVPGITAIRFGSLSLSFFLNGCIAATYAFTPFVYPVALRAKGMGIASSIGRIGAVVAPFLLGQVYAVSGLRGVFLMITLGLFLVALSAAFIVHTIRQNRKHVPNFNQK